MVDALHGAWVHPASNRVVPARDVIEAQHKAEPRPAGWHAFPEAQLSAAEAVSRVPSQLNAVGYAAGPADGIVGPRTRSAIRRFQADAGLPIEGRMSDQLSAALQDQSAP